MKTNNKKQIFWEKKILGWEKDRYQGNQDFSNSALHARSHYLIKNLTPIVKKKKVCI